MRNGKAHPAEYFYSYQEWLERLVSICNDFNDEPQQGKRLQGMTPRQAFYRFLKSPMIKLGEDARHLLAFHRREVKVSQHGVRIRIGKNMHLYTCEATARLQGQKVLAWYSLEDNRFITLTDLNGRNPVTAPLSTVPAWQASEEELRHAISLKNGHRRALREEYRSLKRDHPEEFAHRQRRAAFTDPQTAQLGKDIAAQREAAQSAERDQAKQQRLIREQERRLGLSRARSNRNDAALRARGMSNLDNLINEVLEEDYE